MDKNETDDISDETIHQQLKSDFTSVENGDFMETTTGYISHGEKLKKMRAMVQIANLYNEKAKYLSEIDFPLFVGPSSSSTNFEDRDRQISKQLHELLDELITASTTQEEFLYYKLQWLIYNGQTQDEFVDWMQKNDYSLKCNCIWENDAAAYRCNTCALSPCMSLCSSCFLRNGHAGHDFTRFFSREGGACDCGNPDVLKPDGFCDRHGDDVIKNRPSSALVRLPLLEYIVMKLFVRLFMGLRCRLQVETDDMEDDDPESAHVTETQMIPFRLIVAFLQKLLDIGGPIRESMVRVLMDKKLYTHLTERTVDQVYPLVVDFALDWRFKRQIEEDKRSLCTPDLIEHYKIQDPEQFMKFDSLLDELLFWITRMNFPQSLINVSLKMLSEYEYMRVLALRFFLWYPVTVNSVKQICTLYEEKRVEKKYARNICNRIVHISVQMLSSKLLSVWLNEQVDLTNCLFKSASFLLLQHTMKLAFTYDQRFKFAKQEDDLDDQNFKEVFTWNVIDGENNPLVCQHGYWFIVGDLQNILAHCELARSALLHPEAKHTFVEILSHLQGMYGFYRIVSGDHRVDDRWQPSERAMLLEYELSGSNMCAFTTAILEDRNNCVQAALSYYDVVLTGLQKWLRAVAELKDGQSFAECGNVSSPVYYISFHIPLHRHLANAISSFYGFREFVAHVEKLRQQEHLLRLIVLFPLRIQVARTEQHANMWIRNGVEMRNPCALYPLPHFGVSMMVPDVNLIRFCAANTDPSWFMNCVFDAYHLNEIFTLFKTETGLPSDESMEAEDFVSRSSNMLNLMMEADDNFDCDTRPMETQRKLDDLVKTVFGGTGSPEQPGRQGQLARLLATADEALKVKLSSSLPSVDMNDYPKIKLEWNPDANAVLTRAEWVEHVVTGALRLIASLIVLRINCGNTEEEELTQELVADLASEPAQYSRLKSNRYERIAHSGTAYDEMFDRVLNEISTYLEPDHNGKMQSGRYTLKNMTWISDFCPIYCAFYSHSHRAMAMSYQRVEAIENQLLSKDQKQYVSHVWLPYRIPEFSNVLRHKCVHRIAKILHTDEFCQLALLILVDSESTKLLNEPPLQLVVYLLTIYAKYISQSCFDTRQIAIDKLFKKYSLQTGENYAVHSVFSCVYTMMLSECRKKGLTDDILKKILTGNTDVASSRITGGMIEYMARFFAHLCPVSELAQIMLTLAMREVGMRHSPLSELNGQAPVDVSAAEEAQRLKEKKLAAQKRREAVMASAQKKNLNAMKRVMEKEGLSASDVENITVENKDNLRRYDCPICGELNQPTTANKPFGLLARFNRNALTLVSVADGESVKSLEEIDNNYAHGDRFIRGQRRRYLKNYEDLVKDGCELYRGVFFSSTVPKLLADEFKTCGHTAHIKCFDAYQKSIHEGEMPIHPISHRYVYCPVCRYAIDMQIPVPLDAEITEDATFHVEDDNEKVFDLLANGVLQNFASKGPSVQPLKIGTLSQLRSRINEHQSRMRGALEQTNICQVVKAQIERAVMLCKLKIPDARGNSRLLPIEHLLSAAMVVVSLDDRDFALLTAWDLTMAAGDIGSPSGSMDEEMLEVQPSTSAERNATDEVDMLLAHLSSDELAVVTASSNSEREFPITPTPPPRIETTEQREKIMRSIQQQRKNSVPLLACDLPALLVRHIAFAHFGNAVKAHDKNKLNRLIVRRFMSAVATRAALWMLQRLSKESLRTLADFSAKKYKHKIIPMVLAAIAGSLARHETVFAGLLSQLESEFTQECLSIESAVDTISKHMFDFSLFASELLRALDFEQAYTLTDMDSVFQWLQTDSNCLLPATDQLDYWISHFLPVLGRNYKTKSKVLCHEPLVWQPFTLLELPRNYDDMFCRYFKRPCAVCNTVPSYPLICLLCGQLICLDECCYMTDEKNLSEIERHTRECVQYGGVYLSLTTSYIIVTKRKECGFWGTLYLDSHGEEDYNLRRGKPLELSVTRYNKLKTEWAEQEYPRVPVWWSPQITLENFKANSNRF